MEGVGDEVMIILPVIVLFLFYLLYKTLAAMAPSPQTNNPETPSGPTRSGNIDCAICLEVASFAAQTNCGHTYCASCILEVWRRTNQLSATSCPYCRQRITLILPYFSSEERNTAEVHEIERKNQIIREINTYNRRNSGEPRSLGEILRDLPTLLRHLFRRLFSGEDGFQLAFQLRIFVLMAFSLLYLLSPLDLIPEAVFGFLGLMDDVAVFVLLALYITTLFRSVMMNVGEGAGLGAGLGVAS